ncbi:alpha beta hydrolase fold [Fusarium heterosporum]|uniref:Alpha beta hydrolase fold n=1 Tax=Fusarium heterosporum TaxID=42747 RepID=A0A8H5T8T6_FUSHE|nr:alpha beta hydrolase fold [Fusarium heterosporum]
MPLQASAKARVRSISNPSSWKHRSQPVTPSVARYPLLAPVPITHRQGLPPWDRTFDAVCHGALKKGNFSKVLASFHENHARKKARSGYFRLPDSVRFQICQYLLSDTDKPVCLNKYSFNRDVWRKQDFDTPNATLYRLSCYFRVSFTFRADVLVTFLQQTRLHAVLSPFTGPKVSPLATTWLNLYGMYANDIVVEVDMTHLGCGPDPRAIDLSPSLEQMENLLRDFVTAQLKRDNSCPMRSLVLLCRRFHGKRSSKSTPGLYSGSSSRPASRSAKSPEPYSPTATTPRRYEFELESETLRSPVLPEIRSPTLPSLPLAEEYCPDSYLLFCNLLLYLKGRIASIRMSGFSEDYTTRFIGTLFSSEKNSLAYRVAPSTVWPKLDGQKSYVSLGNSNLVLEEHEVAASNDIPSSLRVWEGCVQLPPPFIDAEGKLLLPALVCDLQQLRNTVARSVTSLSERTSEELSKSGTKGSETSEKKKLAWFKSNHAIGKLKKRAFSKDAAATY